MRKYAVTEVFYSLQGEGLRAGTPNVFVRFRGCNLRCDVTPGDRSPGGFACDTEFESGRLLSPDEIVTWADMELQRRGHGKPVGVIFTGGEPALQLDRELIQAFRAEKYHPLCIETNGTHDVSGLGLDWITLSPKVAEHALKQRSADEVKYVRGYGQAIPNTNVKATYKLISPAFDGAVLHPEVLNWCIRLVQENPEWRLSCQQHKGWTVR